MKLKAYSIYDAKTKLWDNPRFLLNRGTAIRSWDQLVNDRSDSNTISKYPNDFSFFEIGEFDSELGVVTMYKAPESIGLAVAFIRESAQSQSPVLPMKGLN